MLVTFVFVMLAFSLAMDRPPQISGLQTSAAADKRTYERN